MARNIPPPCTSGTGNSIKSLGHGANVDANGYLSEGIAPSLKYTGVVMGTFQNQWVSTSGVTSGYNIPLPYIQSQAQDPAKQQWNAENPSSANGCITINPSGNSVSAANNLAEYVLQYQDPIRELGYL